MDGAGRLSISMAPWVSDRLWLRAHLTKRVGYRQRKGKGLSGRSLEMRQQIKDLVLFAPKAGPCLLRQYLM